MLYRGIVARDVGVFTAVGTTATAINLAVVAIAVPLGLPPLVANAVGFLVSFAWSFHGHARWTFPAEGRDAGVALQRFAVVSLLSFALTEAAYAGMLEWTSIDYRLSAVAVPRHRDARARQALGEQALGVRPRLTAQRHLSSFGAKGDRFIFSGK